LNLHHDIWLGTYSTILMVFLLITDHAFIFYHLITLFIMLFTLQVVSSWIKKVACLHQLPEHQIAVTSATVLTYGSYGLGVSSSIC